LTVVYHHDGLLVAIVVFVIAVIVIVWTSRGG
jgi:hypothetical protein